MDGYNMMWKGGRKEGRKEERVLGGEGRKVVAGRKGVGCGKKEKCGRRVGRACKVGRKDVEGRTEGRA
jgi:hypothetical protein